MAIINPLENLFGKSPIKPMQEHMVVATQAAAKLTAFLKPPVRMIGTRQKPFSRKSQS